VHAPVQRRPFWHCLAFAGIWYAGIVVLNLDGNGLHALAIGFVPWLATSFGLWRIAAVRTWRLIVLALPMFFFLWAVTVVLVAGIVAPLTSS
jgi:hypothetical protein